MVELIMTESLVEPADFLEIVALLHRYAFAMDEADADEIASLFTPEGIWISPFTGTTRGREAIHKLIEQKRARNAATPGEFRRHYITNPIVSVQGDSGEVRASVIETRQRGDQIDVVYTGHYRNAVDRIDGQWRFSSRHCIQDAAGGPWKRKQ